MKPAGVDWAPGRVEHHAPYGDLVGSFTTPDRWYLVNGDGCDHHSYVPGNGLGARTKSCKHIGRVLEFVAAEQELRDPEFRARLRAERIAPFDPEMFVG